MTNRKQAGDALHNWQQIFQQTNWGLLVMGAERHDAAEANPAFARMHGYGIGEMAGKSILDLTAPEFLVEAGGHMVLGELRDNYQFGSMHVHKDGHRFPVQVDIVNIRGSADQLQCRIVNVRDMSERSELEATLKNAREQLRSLSAYQELLLEEERKRIAREVHDELGQKLVAMQLGLSNLRLRYAADPALLGKVEELHALVEDTIDVVRHVASNLRPAALDLGLVQAIDWLAEDFCRRWEIPCRVETGGAKVILDDVVATAVFRVVQESLTNVSRHAGASEVHISLQCDKRQLQLLVRDNGGGFDPAVVREKKGFGLRGMRERVLALGGRLHIDSAPGKGTTMMIELPLPNPGRTDD
ncbi:MAG: PAS domain-containing sensor histidine kinase [Proteobacteria bacterium]|nr:PAS domain-containing sensor histidine kinase [Pseudomonadota bacterium]